ncbi:AAA family ATPase [Actinocrispum sp. NPDC049592]|uniref:ATP-binding protein n=1 Tax=Actinocrispum sp. NPDC049592 TaxID=3154835 RepID=UPI0034334FF7
MTSLERLVGRDAVLAMARAALDTALAGSAQLVLVTGEPGIGKTAVLTRLADEAAERGARVLRATCWDGGAPPYWPWIQALREIEPGLVDSVPRVSTEAEALDARFRLFDATARLLTRAGEDSGLVVLLDDLHWADEASVRMLEFLGRHLGTSRVLLLGAYRDREADLSRLTGTAQRFELLGLDAGEVAAVMTSIAGKPAEDLAEQVWRRSGGNPLFVRELTRLIAARGTADTIPDSVRDTLRSRLARLSHPCAEMLAAAAVGGRVVRPELLSRMGSADPDLLDEAVAARVFTPDLRFSHDLFRETVLAELPARRLAELHHAAGDALESLRENGSPVSAAEIATHYLAAADAAKAVRYSTLAGHEAGERLAHNDAAAHFRTALSTLDLLESPTGRQELLVSLAEALDRAGDAPAARETYRELAELAARTGDARALATAALGMHGLGFRTGTIDTLHLRLLDEAIDLLPAEDLAMRSRVLAALGRDLRQGPKPNPERAAVVATEASTLARASGDPSVLAFSLLAEHDVAWQRGNASRRLAIVSEMESAAEQAADPDMIAQAVLLRATALIELGYPDGLTELHTYVRLCEGLGHSRGRYGALTRRATLALITGPGTEATELAHMALELGQLIGQPDAIPVHGTLHLSLCMIGIVGLEAPVGLGPADPIAPMLPAIRAGVLVASGSLDEAAAEFADFSLGTLVEQPHPELYALMAFVAAAVGSAEQRTEMYQRLLPLAGQHIVVGGCASYSGAVDYHLGRLSAALGNHEDAVRHLTAAVAMHERLGAHPWADISRRELDRLAAPAEEFRREGPLWTLAFQGKRVQLPHVKGLADIARLLSAPRQDVHALELLGRRPAAGADPILDDSARRAYRNRLGQLDSAIDEAASDEEAERLQAERDELIHQLAAATGLGGRPRRLGDDTERARKTVTARIKDALDRIDQVHPTLAGHLRATIRTGTHCRYQPGSDITWRA